MTTKFCKKMQNPYFCEICDFITSNKYNYEMHVLTLKHCRRQTPTNADKKNARCESVENPKNESENGNLASDENCKIFEKNATSFQTELQEKMQKNATLLQSGVNKKNANFKEKMQYTCECGKIYIHRTSLYNHKKKCKSSNEIITSNDVSKDLILKLVDENSEIKSMLFKQFENMQDQQVQIQNQMMEQQKLMHNQINELIPKVGNNNNTITNNVKQKFNINIFLNEQCKDALTMNEFIEKIKVTMDDLMITKNKGLSEGISNIFIENMNKLSLHERPMHCTDVKRETVYIKCDDDNGENGGVPRWEKDEQNTRLKSALNKITHVQRKNMSTWIDKHPNWEENPLEQDEYMKLIKNCTDDINENKRDEKIIKKLCNEVYIG